MRATPWAAEPAVLSRAFGAPSRAIACFSLVRLRAGPGCRHRVREGCSRRHLRGIAFDSGVPTERGQREGSGLGQSTQTTAAIQRSPRTAGMPAPSPKGGTDPGSTGRHRRRPSVFPVAPREVSVVARSSAGLRAHAAAWAPVVALDHRFLPWRVVDPGTAPSPPAGSSPCSRPWVDGAGQSVHVLGQAKARHDRREVDGEVLDLPDCRGPSELAIGTGMCWGPVQDHTTSSALRRRPSWNVTPGRRWNRQVSGATSSQRTTRTGRSV